MSHSKNTVSSVLGGVALGVGLAYAGQYVWNALSSKSSGVSPTTTVVEKQNIPDSTLKQVFVEKFDSIVTDIVSDLPKDLPSLQAEHIKKLMPYTVLDGKMNRGLATVKTYLTIMDYRVTDEDFHRACVLGWCIEMLQAYFLIEDDIMDHSEKRRGKPCWYKLEGMTAINDGMLLQSMIYRLLDIYFEGSEAHPHLVHAFHEVTYLTELGQMLDLLTEQTQPNIDWSVFSLERHSNIVIYKTAFYSFYLPMALGLIQSGMFPNTHAEIFELTRSICVEMGEYFQVQDDFLDCFGTFEQIGKVGRDIEDAKCSWLVNVALSRASDEQRRILEESYGLEDPEAVARIKQVFEDVGVREAYAEYERKSVASIRSKIDQVETLPKEIFFYFLGKIEGRSK